jgi:uncharacterized membrane protein YfhO
MKEDTAILSYFSENKITIDVRTSAPAILLINDIYYPAWKAFVDGKETEIMRGFTSLRAVAVSPGTHVVELRYDDEAFDWGWKISLATLIISIVLLLLPRKQKDSGT